MRSGTSSTSTTSLTQSIEKLDGSMATGQSNYNAWRFRIIRILKEKDLLTAIEDSTVSTTKDDQAFTIVTLNIKDSQIPYIQDATTTKEAWAALKEVHQGIGMNGKMVLMQRLWGLKMVEGEDMAKHLNQCRELSNQLRSLSVDGKGMEDSELVTILTLSLPESYEPLVMALQSRSDTITFDTMAGRLLQEAGRRHIGQANQTAQGNLQSPQTAFTAQRALIATRGYRGRISYQGRGRGGFRTRRQESFGSGSAGQEPRRNTPTPQNTKCHYCGRIGHWKKECYKKKADEASAGTGERPKEFTFLAKDPISLPESGWIIDSGASQHITHYRARYLDYTAVNDQGSVTIADGTKLHAYGIGSIGVATKEGTITLRDVWYVPNIGTSLISVARMVDAGYRVEFNKTTCSISKKAMQTVLGYRHGSLYHINDMSASLLNTATVENKANLGLTTNQSSKATIAVWHRRLCHRSLDENALRYISPKVTDLHVSDKPNSAEKICGICAMGRQHKEAQTKTREKPSELLSMVHSDLCGPMQTPSINGERYFVTFIDEKADGLAFHSCRQRTERLRHFKHTEHELRRLAEKSSNLSGVMVVVNT